MFKNETHNHPTEIEPFGGAATCLGGAIRDPLSGRTYVYQAMRVTGAADPREKFADTLPGKLPQRAITRRAAAGFSSYGTRSAWLRASWTKSITKDSRRRGWRRALSWAARNGHGIPRSARGGGCHPPARRGDGAGRLRRRDRLLQGTRRPFGGDLRRRSAEGQPPDRTQIAAAFPQ